MTDSVFQPLTTAEKIFKDLIWDPMVKTGEVWLEGAVPILALPGVKQLSESELESLTDWAFHQVVLLVDMGMLRLKNAEHERAYRDSSMKLLQVAQAHGPDSDEFKKANEDEKAALAALFTRHVA
jgi:hypothetical protein